MLNIGLYTRDIVLEIVLFLQVVFQILCMSASNHSGKLRDTYRTDLSQFGALFDERFVPFAQPRVARCSHCLA